MSKTQPTSPALPSVEVQRIVRPSYDNWQEAYEEAAGHLDYVAGTGQNELPEGEREAMRRLAKRLRASAARLRPNVPDQATARKTL